MIIAVSRAASAAALSSYQTAVLATSGLTHFWPLGGAGNAATDIVGGMNLTGFSSSAAKLVPNNIEGAQAFTGGSLLSSGNMTWTSALTIECWYKPLGVYTNSGIAGAWDLSAHGAMLVAGVAANTVSLYTDGSGLATAALTLGTTYYIVGTYDGTNRRMYVDGSLVAGPTAGSAVTTNPSAKMEISGYQNGGQPLADSSVVDDVAIYNRALSAAEVSAHWAAR